jgi:hypothetical protein
VAAGGFVLVKAGALRSCDLYVGFSQALEHVEGKGQRRVRTPLGRATQMLALAKPLSMSRGGGLWYEEGGGSARLIAEDCLKCFLFNLEKEEYKRENT